MSPFRDRWAYGVLSVVNALLMIVVVSWYREQIGYLLAVYAGELFVVLLFAIAWARTSRR